MKPRIGLFLLIFSDAQEIRVLGPALRQFAIVRRGEGFVTKNCRIGMVGSNGASVVRHGKLHIVIIRRRSQGSLRNVCR